MSVDSTHRADCREAYDLWAPSYDVIDNPLIAESREVLARSSSVFANARVIEFGCGTGRNAQICLDAGALAYVGIDPSPGMLARARARMADPRARWISGNFDTYALNERFDVALICLVLEHLDEVQSALATTASALVSGGQLVLIELHPSLHEAGVGANFRVGDREVRLPSFRHTAANLAHACEHVGLRVESMEDVKPTPQALSRSQKLGRYAETPVLLKLAARSS